MPEWLKQVALALTYYAGLVLIVRLAGKRLAGQTTTFDLLVLISLGVVLQATTLLPGGVNAMIFIATVFTAHRAVAAVCARSRVLRRLVRGEARPLIWNGQVAFDALSDEGMSYEELLSGLRKLGYASPKRVRLAILEETGHISVVAAEDGSQNG